MSNILVRTLTGAVFITVVLFPLFWRDDVAVGVFALFLILGLIEFYQLAIHHPQIDVSWKTGLVTGFSIFAVISGIALNWLPEVMLVLLLPIVVISPIFELWRKKENPLLNIAVLWMGIFYVVLPFTLMGLWQVHLNHAFPMLAGMFILIWMNDTFAYLSGRFFGKTKLFERISPKKTWEGTVGGALFTFGGAVAMSLLFDPEHLNFWMISSLIIAPCAVLGDLLESLFKRNAGVKDSGALLPGHGGVLDRFDATLFTAPIFLAWSFIYLFL